MDPIVVVLGSAATLAGVPLAISGVAQVLRTAGRAATLCDGRRIRVWAWLASMMVIVPAVRSVPAAHALPPAMEWSDPTPPRAPAAPAVPTRVAGPSYVVKPGDTLWGIAARHLDASGRSTETAEVGRFWRSIYAANRNVVGGDPDLIFPGQRLVIPEV